MKRYAIRFADGSFATARGSDGPLEKAKLWRTIGHVSLHLARFQSYDSGAQVVEVVTTLGNVVVDVDAHMHGLNERRAAKKAKSDMELRRQLYEQLENISATGVIVTAADSTVEFVAPTIWPQRARTSGGWPSDVP